MEKITTLVAGSEFANLYRTLLWAVDVLEGDDPQSDSITDHGMVDADMEKKEIPPPEIYSDKKAGMSNIELSRKHELLKLPGKLRSVIKFAEADQERKNVLLREIDIAEVRIQYTLADEVRGIEKPPLKEMWRNVTSGNWPMLHTFDNEMMAIKDHLMTVLSRLGVPVSNRKTLKAHMEEWEEGQRHLGLKQAPEIEALIRHNVATFAQDFKALLRKIPALAPFADSLSTDAYTIRVLPDMNFDAGLSYIGGVDEGGKPTLAANFEWNAGRPATVEDIVYIAIHEATHMFNASLMDLRRRAGLLGPEAALLTMSSPRAMSEEGLAQTSLEIICGGSLYEVMKRYGPAMCVIILQDQLQDIARMFAAIAWNRDLAHLPEEERRLEIYNLIKDDLLQTEHIANKYAGPKKKFWRMMPGGVAYAPAYYYGSRAYRQAISDFGVEKTLAVGCHGRGLVDLEAFQKKVMQ